METNDNISDVGLPEPSPSLISAIRHILRPLVRLLLTHSITYPYVSNLLKSIYVEVATEDFRLQGKPQTDSRVSLLSGVHRKDVKHLRPDRTMEQTVPPTVSLSGKLLQAWSSDPKRLDETGRHRPLPRLMSEGGGSSFESLVASVSKDIRSRVILDEWLRTGIASIDDQGRVCLNTVAFLKESDFDERAYFVGQNVHDHLSAAAQNLSGGHPPLPERSIQHSRLSEASVAELSTLAKKLGAQMLDTIGQRASELEARDASNSEAQQRMRVGIYFYNGIPRKSEAAEASVTSIRR